MLSLALVGRLWMVVGSHLLAQIRCLSLESAPELSCLVSQIGSPIFANSKFSNVHIALSMIALERSGH